MPKKGLPGSSTNLHTCHQGVYHRDSLTVLSLLALPGQTLHKRPILKSMQVTARGSLMRGSCPLQVMVWDANVNKAISHVLDIEKDLQANMKIE